MPYKLIDKTTSILEQIRKVTDDIKKYDLSYFEDLYFKKDYFEHFAHLVKQIESESYNLKKEIILAQLKTNIPNKEIAHAFKISPARISQLKAEMEKIEEIKKIREFSFIKNDIP